MSALRETDGLSIRRAFGMDISSGGRAMETDVILAQGEIVRLFDPKDSGRPSMPVFAEVRWAVPADGEYLVAVRDHLGKGGPEYVYRVEFNPLAASLYLPVFATQKP